MIERWVVVLLFIAGCSGATKTGVVRGDNGKTMLGLEEPIRVTDRWEIWTPTDDYKVPDVFTADNVAFDYWIMRNDSDRESAWAVLFSVLDYLRGQSEFSDGQQMSINSLMASLEGKDAQLDLTFYVSKTVVKNSAEGFSVRFARQHGHGGTASITVVMERKENSKENFSHLLIWLDPGFKEAPFVTLSANHDGGRWIATMDQKEIDLTPVLTVLQNSFWEETTHSAYIERAQEASKPPRLFNAALGLQLKDRAIESVYSDTVFPPRLTLGPTQ